MQRWSRRITPNQHENGGSHVADSAHNDISSHVAKRSLAAPKNDVSLAYVSECLIPMTLYLVGLGGSIGRSLIL